MLNDATLFHFGYPTLMRSMYENDGAELIALFKKVKECGCATSLDLSAVAPDTEAGKAGIEKELAEGARTMMELIPYEIEAMKEVVREKITLFGSANACH